MVLSNTSIKRLVNDVKYVKNNLDKDNIYYKHNEENITLGYAMIIGNEDSPYRYGYYFFEFNFPDDYPFSPPVVKFLTSDGYTRFHPNYYINGKVCLSLLNTWQGDGWTSCCNIHTILIILSSLLINNSLLNEPGIKNTDENIKKYDLIIGYKNIEFSIINQYNRVYNLDKYNYNSNNSNNYEYNNIMYLFKENIYENIKINYDNILDYINFLKIVYKNDYNSKTIIVTTYSLNCDMNFEKLISDLNDIKYKKIIYKL
tara:strand:+ start:721 stop:1494 length:774 start_codon:yes stop_codon:yes gene_type:complete